MLALLKNIEIYKKYKYKIKLYERQKERERKGYRDGRKEGESRDTTEMLQIKVIRGFKMETKEKTNEIKNVFGED